VSFFFSSRRRHTRFSRDWSSDVCSSDLRIDNEKLERLVREHFDLRPYGILKMLDLVRPIYRPTSTYGHFGREEPGFTWEKTDKRSEERRVGKECRARRSP